MEHVAPTPGSFRVEESTAEAFGQKWFGCGAVRRREQDPVGEEGWDFVLGTCASGELLCSGALRQTRCLK